MDFSASFSNKEKPESEQGWADFPANTADISGNGQQQPFGGSFAAWSSVADGDGAEDNPAPTAVTPGRSPGRSPKRESKQDKVKRRSILEGLSSFQIPGGDGGNASEISEDFSNSTSASEQPMARLDQPLTNNDGHPSQAKSGNHAGPPPQQIAFSYPSGDKNSPTQLGHGLTDPPHRRQQHTHKFQKRPRRSSLQTPSSFPIPKNDMMTRSKSVRFQMEGDRVVKAGELSSHTIGLELQQRKETERKRHRNDTPKKGGPSKQGDDHINRNTISSSKATKNSKQGMDLSAGSSEHNSVDKRHRQKQSKQQQKPLRQTASLSDLGFNGDPGCGTEKKEEHSFDDPKTSKVRSKLAKETYSSKAKRGGQKTSAANGVGGMDPIMGTLLIDVSIDTTDVMVMDGIGTKGIPAAKENDVANRTQKLLKQRQNEGLTFATYANDESADNTIGKYEESMLALQRKAGTSQTELKESEPLAPQNATGSETKRYSSRRSSSKGAKARKSSLSPKKDIDQPIDRRRLLRKTSSLSELEVMAKRKGRRKTKKEQTSRAQEQQKRMHKSFSAFNKIDLPNDSRSRSTDHQVEGVLKGFPLLGVNIDVDGGKEKGERGKRDDETESDTNSKIRTSRNDVSKREPSRHERQGSPQKDYATKLLSKSEHVASIDDSSVGRAGRRGQIRRTSTSSLTELDNRRAKGRRPEERRSKNKAHSGLNVHKSRGHIEGLPKLYDSKEIKDTSSLASVSTSRSEQHHRDSQLCSTPPLTTKSEHVHTSIGAKSSTTPSGGKRHSGRDGDADMDKSQRRGCYYDRMKVHRNLHQLNSENDDIGKLDMYQTDGDQDVAASGRSSWSDRDGTADRASKRRGRMTEREKEKSSNGMDRKSPRHQSLPSSHDGSAKAVRSTEKVRGNERESPHALKDKVHPHHGDEKMQRDGPKRKFQKKHEPGGSLRSPQKQSSPLKSTKKVTPSHDTDTTIATSTTARPSNSQQGEGPIKKTKNRRNLLRKNSSLNDLDEPQNRSSNGGRQSSKHSPEKWMHKSLRQVDGEPVLEDEPSRHRRGRVKGDMDRRRRRSSVARRNAEHGVGVESDPKEESGRQASGRARSRNKSQYRRSSRKQSKSERDRSKSRARSKSRHGRNTKTDGNDGTTSLKASDAPDDAVPKNVFAGRGTTKEADDDSYSSLEGGGASVILDRRKEERKKAKENASKKQQMNDSLTGLTNKLNASMADLDLNPEASSNDQFRRLNKSMGNFDATREKKTKDKKRATSKPRNGIIEAGILPERGETPALRRSDSGISSLGFPPPERRKRAPGSTTAKASSNSDVIPPIPRSIVIGAKEDAKILQAKERWTFVNPLGSISPCQIQQMYSSSESLEIPPRPKTQTIDRLHLSLNAFASPQYEGFKAPVLETGITKRAAVAAVSLDAKDDDESAAKPEDKSVPRWKSRLSTHSILNDFQRE